MFIPINIESFPTSLLDVTKKTVLIINKPGHYQLEESIIIGSSDAGDTGNFIDFGRQIGPPPFHFGIWAAISIAADNVTIDLNEHTISMTDNFARQQRFFSLVELANQPFPKGKGGFPFDIIPSNHVIIKNGTLSNSSHHCIHGNFNRHVLLEDLKLNNFEVAAIAINSGHHIKVKNCLIDGTRKNVPVIATFALVQDLKSSLKTILNNQTLYAHHNQASNFLNNGILNNILNNPGHDEYGITTNKIINNNEKLLDGNLFGLYFNNQFSVGELTTSGSKTSDITIEDCLIRKISSNASEVISICENDKVYRDNKGYNLRYDYLFNKEGFLKNIETESDFAQLFITQLQLFCLQVLSNKTTLLNKFVLNQERLNTAISYSMIGVQPLGGLDSRAHVLKGNFGIRIDSGKDIHINRVKVEKVENYGSVNNDVKKTNYSKFPIALGGFNNEKDVYKGNMVFGISLSNCENCTINETEVVDNKSVTGYAIGLTILNTSTNCQASHLDVRNMQGSVNYNLYIDPTSYNNSVSLKTIEDTLDQSKHNIIS